MSFLLFAHLRSQGQRNVLSCLLAQLLTCKCSIKNIPWPGAVAQTYNSSCSEGRAQEDCGSKPARENSSQSPISGFFLSQEIPITKKGLMEWLKV
jgi:hypothetical protein